MDVDSFERMIASQPKEALLKILENVRRQNVAKHEELVLRQLDSRFPGWDTQTKANVRGRTFNRAIYRGDERTFSTAKDGFAWLAEQMMRGGEQRFTGQDKKAELAVTKRRRYLARSPRELFTASPHLADDPNNYVKLRDGWYLNVNLSNTHKFEVLARLSWVVDAKFPADWDWIVDANTEDFDARRSRQKAIQEIHEFLEGLLENPEPR